MQLDGLSKRTVFLTFFTAGIVQLLILGGSLAKAQGSGQPFTITIAGPTTPVKVGGDCDVQITATNVSNRTIGLLKAVGDQNGFLDYHITILNNGDGKEVARTALGNRVEGKSDIPVHSSYRIVKLKPGEELTLVSSINKIVNLSKPGLYKVQVSRDLPSDLGTGTVTSNTITIQIIQ